MVEKKSIFTKETFRFFRDLEKNNRTQWMHDNRHRYEAHIVAPFRKLLEALAPVILSLNPGFDIAGKTGGNFSRINRDIRFARDKSPYRPQMYLMISEPAPKGQAAGQLYVGVSPKVATAGFRIYGERKKSPLAERARPRALAHADWLALIARKLGRKYESYWHATEKSVWNRHEGWPVRDEEWNRLEAWIVRRVLDPADAQEPAFVKEVEKIFRELMPLWSFTSAPEWRLP